MLLVRHEIAVNNKRPKNKNSLKRAFNRVACFTAMINACSNESNSFRRIGICSRLSTTEGRAVKVHVLPLQCAPTVQQCRPHSVPGRTQQIGPADYTCMACSGIWHGLNDAACNNTQNRFGEQNNSLKSTRKLWCRTLLTVLDSSPSAFLSYSSRRVFYKHITYR